MLYIRIHYIKFFTLYENPSKHFNVSNYVMNA
jgi:hypothetical protein